VKDGRGKEGWKWVKCGGEADRRRRSTDDQNVRERERRKRGKGNGKMEGFGAAS
jgi:hypothetical protein